MVVGGCRSFLLLVTTGHSYSFVTLARSTEQHHGLTSIGIEGSGHTRAFFCLLR